MAVEMARISGFRLKRRKPWRLRSRTSALLSGVGSKFRFTSIAARIIVVNIIGLIVVVGGILALNQSRANIMDSRIDNLVAQAHVIATAITLKTPVNPDRQQARSEYVLQFEAGGWDGSFDSENASLPAALNPEWLTPFIRHLAKQTAGARARVFDREGNLLADSKPKNGAVLRSKLEPFNPSEHKAGLLENFSLWLRDRLGATPLPLHKDAGLGNGAAYPVFQAAVKGEPMRIVGVNERGDTIISVGVPIQIMRDVLGVVMLTSPEGEIDQLIAQERGAILGMAIISVVGTIFLALYMGHTIASPMHDLAVAAEQVRRSIKSREPIPDFTKRSDEIGYLSRALRDMTSALYRRMDAIESFAADVSHELKNPLTSLLSATDALPKIKNEADRERLMDIIQDDVRRMNRLISDISDASRLDAELAREHAEPVDAAKLADAVCSIINGAHRGKTPELILKIGGKPSPAGKDFIVSGHESRLSQVMTNIIDNAISFSPEHGKIYVTCKRLKKTREIEISVEDDGPGIPPENLHKVFTRFYTDRPAHEKFGQNSGLGLHISQQIVLAHGGRLWAENRMAQTPGVAGGLETYEGKRYGARFVIRLPAL